MTDGLIERDNSAGPLLNLRGELVGINVARAGDTEGAGYGFAIPRTLFALDDRWRNLFRTSFVDGIRLCRNRLLG